MIVEMKIEECKMIKQNTAKIEGLQRTAGIMNPDFQMVKRKKNIPSDTDLGSSGQRH
jgi:hypothetical protein